MEISIDLLDNRLEHLANKNLVLQPCNFYRTLATIYTEETDLDKYFSELEIELNLINYTFKYNLNANDYNWIDSKFEEVEKYIKKLETIYKDVEYFDLKKQIVIDEINKWRLINLTYDYDQLDLDLVAPDTGHNDEYNGQSDELMKEIKDYLNKKYLKLLVISGVSTPSAYSIETAKQSILNKKKLKTKLGVLDKLGIIDLLISRIGENRSHLARILKYLNFIDSNHSNESIERTLRLLRNRDEFYNDSLTNEISQILNQLNVLE